MIKIYLLLIITAFALPAFLFAGNRELVDQPPRSHIVDENGEVILKHKKADWIYDCKDCHKDFKAREDAREMTSEHTNLMYDHIKGRKWCFVCHYKELEKRDRILMPGGETYTGPQDMIKICIQCHGKKAKEWEIGIHGKITGSWITWGDAKREKVSCNHCHSPHHPRSVKVAPFPAPNDRLKKKGYNHE
ncbi:MAG: hypothetical protein GY765_21850 [bacterium]|nr:hypothetical protein [bacterium]